MEFQQRGFFLDPLQCICGLSVCVCGFEVPEPYEGTGVSTPTAATAQAPMQPSASSGPAAHEVLAAAGPAVEAPCPSQLPQTHVSLASTAPDGAASLAASSTLGGSFGAGAADTVASVNQVECSPGAATRATVASASAEGCAMAAGAPAAVEGARAEHIDDRGRDEKGFPVWQRFPQWISAGFGGPVGNPVLVTDEKVLELAKEAKANYGTTASAAQAASLSRASPMVTEERFRFETSTTAEQGVSTSGVGVAAAMGKFVVQPRGMVNTGVKCYLNSVMQALASCSALAEVLHTSQLPEAQPRETRTDLVREFEVILRKLRHGGLPGAPSVAADAFDIRGHRLTCALSGSHGQQDSQEFVCALLDTLHEHLKRPLSEHELDEMRNRLTRSWRECTGEEWKDKVQLACHDHCKMRHEDITMSPPPPQVPLQTSIISHLFEGAQQRAPRRQFSECCPPAAPTCLCVPSRFATLCTHSLTPCSLPVQRQANCSPGSSAAPAPTTLGLWTRSCLSHCHCQRGSTSRGPHRPRGPPRGLHGVRAAPRHTRSSGVATLTSSALSIWPCARRRRRRGRSGWPRPLPPMPQLTIMQRHRQLQRQHPHCMAHCASSSLKRSSRAAMRTAAKSAKCWEQRPRSLSSFPFPSLVR